MRANGLNGIITIETSQIIIIREGLSSEQGFFFFWGGGVFLNGLIFGGAYSLKFYDILSVEEIWTKPRVSQLFNVHLFAFWA